MGRDTLIDWQLGTQAGFDAAAPLGTRHDELICRRPGVAPLSDWSRAIAPHGQRTRVDDGPSAAARFARLSNTEKLGVALRTTARAVGPEMGGKLQELISPTNLAIMAGALAIWVGAHATPIGWVVDIGMVGLGVVALGAEAVSVMREVYAFAMGVVKAKSDVELMQAGRHLAKAIAIVGVDVVVAILLKKAIVKVREPAAAAGEAAGGQQKLFGKYDPKDAVRSLPAKTAVSDTKSAASVANGANQGGGFVRFTSDFDAHILVRDFGVPPKRGIGGAHNLDEFNKYRNEINVVGTINHPSANGVQTIKYQMPALDPAGNPTGGFRSKIFEKTVFDPKLIAPQDFLTWGRQAAAQGQSLAPLNRTWTGTAPNGLSFMGYLDDTGAIRSFFPNF